MPVNTTFSPPPRVVDLCVRVYPDHATFIHTVASEQNVSSAQVIREIIDRFMKLYEHRKGTFRCQSCGKEQKNKERHEVTVENDVYIFGDCCYFNDKYKEMVRRMI